MSHGKNRTTNKKHENAGKPYYGEKFMTEREAAIVTAYTGFLIGDFSVFHAYAEELMERPVQTIEFASEEVFRELRKRSYNDFTSIKVEKNNE